MVIRHSLKHDKNNNFLSQKIGDHRNNSHRHRSGCKMGKKGEKMRGYDFFLVTLCLSVVLIPLFLLGTRGIEWLWNTLDERRKEREAAAYIKRVLKEE